VIGVVKPGFTVQISRPTNGRRGRISRPTNLHITSETPVLAMARLGKKNKLCLAVRSVKSSRAKVGFQTL